LKHLLKQIVVGILEIDKNDIRLGIGDLAKKISHVADYRYVELPGVAQAFLENGSADDIIVDDQYSEGGFGHSPDVAQQYLCCNAKSAGRLSKFAAR